MHTFSAQMLGTNPFNYCCVISFVGAVYNALSCFTWHAVSIHTVAVWSLTSDSKWTDFFLHFSFVPLCPFAKLSECGCYEGLCVASSLLKKDLDFFQWRQKSSPYSFPSTSLYWNVSAHKVALTSLGGEKKNQGETERCHDRREVCDIICLAVVPITCLY